MRKYLVVSGIGTTLFLGACQILLGLEDRVAVAPADAAQARPDASTDAGTDAPDPCTLSNVPDRPTTADEDSGTGDLVFALYQVHFGLDGGLPFGVNLDNRCTCPAPDSCHRPKDASTACDTPNGVDNAGQNVLSLLRGFGVLDEGTLNENLAGGGSGALLRVESYNGRANDRFVTVSIYGSLGIQGVVTGTPKDRWKVDTASLRNGRLDQPLYLDELAYVKDSVLVAKFNFPIALGGDGDQPPLRADLRSGHILANLVDSDGGVAIHGVLAGRWPTTSTLGDIQSFPDPSMKTQPLCASTSFQLVRQLVCGAADIAVEPKDDGVDGPCGAISVQIGFDGRLATFGDVRQRPDAGLPVCDGGAPSCF